MGQITASERGCLVTVSCCVNAVGRVLPPAMIFPRVHYKSHMTHGAPTGTLGLATSNGWMNSDLFVKVFKHFVSNIGCSKNKPIIMLMDNHESNLSIDIVDHAIDNGVTIITFPPHCSHRLQPHDVLVYGPLKRYYNKAVDELNLSNPEK